MRSPVRIIAPLILIAGGSIAALSGPASAAVTLRPAAAVRPAAPAAKAVYFHTLPPGAKLPSGAACAKLVNKAPLPEDLTSATIWA